MIHVWSTGIHSLLVNYKACLRNCHCLEMAIF